MKKIILIAVLLISFASANSQSNYTYIAQRYRWLAGLFEALGLPSGAGPAGFQTGQSRRAGQVYYDSVGVDAGFYIWNGTFWQLQGGELDIPAVLSLIYDRPTIQAYHILDTANLTDNLRNDQVTMDAKRVFASGKLVNKDTIGYVWNHFAGAGGDTSPSILMGAVSYDGGKTVSAPFSIVTVGVDESAYGPSLKYSTTDNNWHLIYSWTGPGIKETRHIRALSMTGTWGDMEIMKSYPPSLSIVAGNNRITIDPTGDYWYVSSWDPTGISNSAIGKRVAVIFKSVDGGISYDSIGTYSGTDSSVIEAGIVFRDTVGYLYWRSGKNTNIQAATVNYVSSFSIGSPFGTGLPGINATNNIVYDAASDMFIAIHHRQGWLSNAYPDTTSSNVEDRAFMVISAAQSFITGRWQEVMNVDHGDVAYLEGAGTIDGEFLHVGYSAYLSDGGSGYIYDARTRRVPLARLIPDDGIIVKPGIAVKVRKESIPNQGTGNQRRQIMAIYGMENLPWALGAYTIENPSQNNGTAFSLREEKRIWNTSRAIEEEVIRPSLNAAFPFYRTTFTYTGGTVSNTHPLRIYTVNSTDVFGVYPDGRLFTTGPFKPGTFTGAPSFTAQADGFFYYNSDSLGLVLRKNSGWYQIVTSDMIGIDNVLSKGQALTTNRTITTGANVLTVTGSSVSGTLNAQNTGTGAALIGANTTFGIGVHGLSDAGVGVRGSSTSSAGVFGISDSGDPGVFEGVPSSTNSTYNILNLVRSTTGTAANNIAGAIRFSVERDNGSIDAATNRIISRYATVANASRTSHLDIEGENNAVTETFMNIQPSLVRINNNADTLATRAYARSVSGSGGGGGTPPLTQYRIAVGDASNLLSDNAAITGNRALISDANGVPTHSPTDATELGYVDGVTSAIQTQIDSKLGHTTANPAITATTPSGTGIIGVGMPNILSSDNTISDVNTAQNVFPSASDVLTVQASTLYFIEGKYHIISGANTHSVGMGFALGGGASVTGISYTAISIHANSQTSATQNMVEVTSVNNTLVGASAAADNTVIRFSGWIRINAGGTVTPQITFSATTGATPNVKVNSWINFTPVGTNTFTSAGAWN